MTLEPLPRLYLITDRNQCLGRPLVGVVQEAVDAGCRLVQLRESGLTDREALALAQSLKTVASEAGAKLLINDRLDLCLASGADGVHCKVTSPHPGVLRPQLRSGSLIGVSTHSVEEALKAQTEGADFLVFGPVYDTPSKRPYGPPVGLESLRLTAKAVTIPVLALGGITVKRVPEVMACGAHGVALISTVCGAERPGKAVRRFLQEL